MLGKIVSAVFSDSKGGPLNLNTMDWKSILYQCMDAGIGAILTVVQTSVIPSLPPVYAMIANTVIAKILRKFVSVPTAQVK